MFQYVQQSIPHLPQLSVSLKTVRFLWGRVGISGNETADFLATSTPDSSPRRPYLQNPCLRYPSSPLGKRPSYPYGVPYPV